MKEIRLSKVARELSVGISTIVDFANSQNIEIEAKPNTKISSKFYELLRFEFKNDNEVVNYTEQNARGHFITSRKGVLKEVKLFQYNLKEKTANNKEAKQKLKNWLYSTQHLFAFAKDHFTTLNELESIETSQYFLHKTSFLEPPFNNVPLISNFLGRQLRKNFARHYNQFLNTNTFILKAEEIDSFSVLHCFNFNIQLFSNGEFYVHFNTASKITSGLRFAKQFVNSQIWNEKLESEPELYFMVLRAVGKKLFHQRIICNDKDSLNKASKYIMQYEATNDQMIATFNTGFLSHYFNSEFPAIQQSCNILQEDAIQSLIKPSNQIKISSKASLHYRPFLKIVTTNFAGENNLLVGNKKAVNNQAAAHFNGMYRQVESKVILPILFHGFSLPDFFEKKLKELNCDYPIQILEPMICEKETIIEAYSNQLADYKKQYGVNLFVSLLAKFNLTADTFKHLSQFKIPFQPNVGSFSDATLSNYWVKCIEKMGGMLSTIKDSREAETTYFIGIDLGHDHKQELSSLAVVVYSYKGEFLFSKKKTELPLNEALNEQSIKCAFTASLKQIRLSNFPTPRKLIIHRDGKLHQNDIELMRKNIPNEIELDVVEIIKSGHPILGLYNGGYQSVKSGDAWFLHHQNYALLATNTQNKNVPINPIIVKHKYGKTPFENIVFQIYWLTKIYTNNLYFSSRLPATTNRANSFARTGKNRYVSSYSA